MTKEENLKATVSLMFLTSKRNGTIKVHIVYEGKTNRDWISKE